MLNFHILPNFGKTSFENLAALKVLKPITNQILSAQRKDVKIDIFKIF
jgi:hypothetical protein